MTSNESPAEREARLLAEAEAELLEEQKHLQQEALGQKSSSSEAAPGRFARALYRLGFQSKMPLVDPIVNEQSSRTN